LKNGVFWDVTPCGCCKNRRSGETYRINHQGDKNRKTSFLRSILRLLVTANAVPSLPILSTLMMEAIRSSETSIFTRTVRRNIPGGGFLHSHRRENLKSYII
jgi:hypothetical protein